MRRMNDTSRSVKSLREQYILKQRGSLYTIRGTSDSDLKAAIGTHEVITEDKSTYLIPSDDLILMQQGGDLPDVFRVRFRGDGYVRDYTILQRVAKPSLVERLTQEAMDSLSRVEEEYE